MISLGDPGADSGGGKSLNGREKNSGEEKSRRIVRVLGDKVLTDQFQTVGAVLACDWWQKIFVFISAQSQSSDTSSRFVFSYTKYTYPPIARHRLTEGLLEEKSSKYSTKCEGNPQETRRKYAGPFTSIVVLSVFKGSRVCVQTDVDR